MSLSLLFLLLIFSSSLVDYISCQCAYGVNITEFNSLYDLYNSTSGKHSWVFKTPYSTNGYAWNFTALVDPDEYLTRPCAGKWQGITCLRRPGVNPPQCMIASLVLAQMSLDGTLPSSIGGLFLATEIQILQNPRLTGRIPSDICSLEYLDVVQLSGNDLTGTIPTEFGNVVGMLELYLDFNRLKGHLPTQLGSLTLMETLSLGSNLLSGPIPTEYGNLQSIKILSISRNKLTGTIPIGLVLHSLTELDLNTNHLVGPIYSQFGTLLSCTKLLLDGNLLTGPIPTELGLLSAMTDLSLAVNYLWGHLPDELSAATKLQSLGLNTNFLTGNIPGNYSTLAPSLRMLFLQSNELQGTIPEVVCSLTSLEGVYFEFNSFFGTIPSCLSSLTNVTNMYLNVNEFTGTMPSFLGLLPLKILNLQVNSFYGSIPIELYALTNLGNLFLDANLLTGPLPNNYAVFPRVTKLSLELNYFTGTISSSISAMNTLTVLYMNGNYLSGSLPTELAMLTSLVQLNLNGNTFSGSITDVFDIQPLLDNTLVNTSFAGLTFLDISDNAFTGSFPSGIFAFCSLDTVSASSNCFSGELACRASPSNISFPRAKAGISQVNSKLTTIDLSGLSSGYKCRNFVVSPKYFPDAGYYPNNYMSGSIPSCFWLMPSLTTLYLTGNGFGGNLDFVDSIGSTNLINISLGYNQLTGTLPATFQTNPKFQYVDIAYNRISGVLLDSYVENGTFVNISVNRISGSLPSSLVVAPDLVSFILTGNMFSFEISQVPGESQQSALVFLKSLTLDIALLCTSPLFILFIVVVMWRSLRSIRAYDCQQIRLFNWIFANKWVEEINEMKFLGTPTWKYAREFMDFIWVCSCAIILLLSLLYLVVKGVPSLAAKYATYTYQYGWIYSAAYLHGVFPVVFIVLVMASISVVVATCLHAISSENVIITHALELYVKAKLFCFYMINVVIILGVNYLYLLAVFDSNPFIQIIQAALALFKLVWFNLYVRYSWKLSSSTFVSSFMMPYQYATTLFNFVIAPCVATTIVESSCFYELFRQSPAPIATNGFCPINDRFYYDKSDKSEFICVGSVTVLESKEFLPPFMYSYQCGSALIVNYVPVLLYTYLFSAIITPIILWIVFAAMEKYGLKPQMKRLLPPLITGAVVSSRSRLFNITQWSSKILLNLTLLLTFGAASPYLGIVILAASLVEIYLMVISVGRYRWLQRNDVISCDGQNSSTSPELSYNNGQSNVSNPVSSNSGVDSSVNSKQATTIDEIRFGDSHTEEFNRSKKVHNEVASRNSADEQIVLCLEGCWYTSVPVLATLIVVIWMFWALVSFDMIADIYGKDAGIATIVTIIFVMPAVIFVCTYLVFNWFLSPTVLDASSSGICANGQPITADASEPRSSFVSARTRSSLTSVSFARSDDVFSFGRECNSIFDSSSVLSVSSSNARLASESNL